MCGLFGAIGSRISSDKIRSLALVNRERGTHGTGLFDSSGKFIKTGSDALDALATTEFSKFIGHRGRWFLAGHTRYATRGSKTKRNAHPFRYGCIIGAHNGIVSAPHSYKVDSEYLFDSLNKAGGDYQRAFAKIDGYWGLTWFDGDAFYIQAHENDIWLGQDKRGTFYYSSDYYHLAAATGISESWCISNGMTLRFRAGGTAFEELPAFTSKVVRSKSVKLDPRTIGKSSAKSIVQEGNSYYDGLAYELGYSSLQNLADVEYNGDLRYAKDIIDCEFRGSIAFRDSWTDYTGEFN